MELLVLPSLLAIGLKIAIFMRYHGSLRRENINLGIFFLAIFFLNFAELFSIEADYSHAVLLQILLAYYCCVVFVIHAYINLCLDYSEFKWHVGRIKTALNIALPLLIVALIASRGIVSDVVPTAYSLTRIAGEFYWIFQVYALGGLIFAVSCLVYGLRKSDSNLLRQRCLIVLISTTAPVLTTFGVIGAMAAGVEVNAAIFMSLALTAMLGMMIYAEEKTRLFRLLTFIPYTKERKLHKQLLAHVTDCIAINDDPAQQQSLNLKQMMREFEGSVVEHVLSYYGGNQKKTASALGVSEATVSRRARAKPRLSTENDTQTATDYMKVSIRSTE